MQQWELHKTEYTCHAKFGMFVQGGNHQIQHSHHIDGDHDCGGEYFHVVGFLFHA
jgi:hypothetical protein